MNKDDKELLIASMAEVIKRERAARDRLLDEQLAKILALEAKVLEAEAKFAAMSERFRDKLDALIEEQRSPFERPAARLQ